MKDDKPKTPFQEFLEEGKTLGETKRSVLSPGAVEYIHLNKRVEDLIQPIWEKIRSKPTAFPPAQHDHLREESVDLPWLWTEVSKDGSSLLDLDKRLHSDLEGVTADQHHAQTHSHALDDLTDVNAPSPADTNVLTWDAATSKWLPAAAGGALALDDLTDVNAPAPTDQFVLTWNAATGKWIDKAVPAGGALALDDLTDVNAAAPGDKEILTWNAVTSKWIAAALGLLDDLSDVVITTVADGDIIHRNASNQWVNLAKATEVERRKFLRTGTPAWEEIGEADLAFIDNFADSSRHWAWYDERTDANRTITESGSVLTIATPAGTVSDWWTGVNSCQKALIGLPGFPCEIITKLNSYTVNNQTEAGLALSRDPRTGSPNADSAIFIGRFRDDGAGQAGYCVQNLGSSIWAYQATTTLPVWFRIRIGYDISGSIKADFSYSTDGITYTVLYTSTGSPAAGTYPIVAALHVRNWGGLAISAPFEFFKMTRSMGPG